MSQTATEIMPRLRCDVSLRNEDGITALELAEQLNQAEVLALLQRQNTKQVVERPLGRRLQTQSSRIFKRRETIIVV